MKKETIQTIKEVAIFVLIFIAGGLANTFIG